MEIQRELKKRVILSTIVLLLSVVLPFYTICEAHWFQTHQYMIDLACQAYKNDGKPPYCDFLGTFYINILKQGVYDADARVAGIYAVDFHCSDLTIDLTNCPESEKVANDIPEIIVGDHGYNPQTRKGLSSLPGPIARVNNDWPWQSEFNQKGMGWADPENKIAKKLLAVLKGKTSDQKKKTLLHLMQKSNAADLASFFYNRALGEWRNNHPIDAFYNLGIALHAVQDVSVPDHSKLVTNSPYDYERYVWETYLDKGNAKPTVSGDYINKTPANWVKMVAGESFILDLNPSLSAPESVRLGAASTAGFLMDFFTKVNIDEPIIPTSNPWAKTYGGAGNDFSSSIQQTSDGGYIVAGYTSSFGAGSGDVWVLKLDGNGNIQWQKAYGGTDFDYASSVQQTSDGGYIVAGYTDSFGVNSRRVWALKLDGNGNIQWQKAYGSDNWDEAFSVQQTSDGGYIVAGQTSSSFSASSGHVWLLKLDGNGSVQWQKAYGGNNWEQAFSIQQTSDKGYIVAGYTDSFGAGSGDVWVLKLDGSGNIQWQKAYGGNSVDVASSIQQTSDGGYIVAGYTSSFGAGSGGVWLLKLRGGGSIQWQKAYGGTDASSIQQTSDGGYVVAGYTSSFGAGSGDVWVLKLDGSGNIQWQKAYGGNSGDGALSVQQTFDGGYVVAGRAVSFGAGNGDVWILKLDTNGNVPFNPSTGAFITNINVTPTDTFATITKTNASILNTSIIPTDTSKAAIDTNAIVSQQAP